MYRVDDKGIDGLVAFVNNELLITRFCVHNLPEISQSSLLS